jgi:predicted Zn-dependent peptidase
LSDFALDMLLEGNGGLDSAAIAARIRDLGAEIETYTHTDSAGVRLSALKENIDASAALFARLIRQPDFPADAIERLRGQTLARLGREENDGGRLAQRVLPRLVFGVGSPDSGPLSNTGRREVVTKIDREQLQAFHQRWFNPARTTLIAVGDLTLPQLQQLAERNFTDAVLPGRKGDKATGGPAWPNGLAPIPDDNASATAAADQPTLYFIDNPGSSQANISAALAVPAGRTLDLDALTLTNQIFGGGFTSRLNLNLREEKHWSYGTRSSLVESRGQQLWIASGNVQIDQTGPALQEMRREMREISSGKRPVAADELDKVREQRIRQLPGAYDTNRELLEAMSKNVQLQRADDYPATEGTRLRALDLEALRHQAATFGPDAAVWLAVGDKQKILPQLQNLDWARIVELDKQGEPIGR